MSRGLVNRGAIASLVAARIVYAANFYNLAAVYALIAVDLGQNVAGLGLASSGFLLGIGVFQIPGGIFAATSGPRRAAAYGTLLASGAVTLTAMAPQLSYIILLRFVVGLGMAFVFAPGVALTVRYFREGSEGLAVGIYNSSFSFGSIVGLSGWVVLAEFVGWRLALLAGGIMGLATGLGLLLLIPSEPNPPEGFRVKRGDLWGVLTDRRLLLMGVGLVGINTALNLVNNFVVYYLQTSLGVPAVRAAFVASLSWIADLFVALASGRIYDRVRKPKGLILASAVASAAGMALISEPHFYTSVVGAILVGSAVGIGSTVAFSVAHGAGKDHPRYESLAISWVNTVHYFGSFWSTLLFSFLAIVFSYDLAWLLTGAAIFPFVLPLLVVRLQSGRRTPTRVVAPPAGQA